MPVNRTVVRNTIDCPNLLNLYLIATHNRYMYVIPFKSRHFAGQRQKFRDTLKVRGRKENVLVLFFLTTEFGHGV